MKHQNKIRTSQNVLLKFENQNLSDFLKIGEENNILSCLDPL